MYSPGTLIHKAVLVADGEPAIGDLGSSERPGDRAADDFDDTRRHVRPVVTDCHRRKLSWHA